MGAAGYRRMDAVEYLRAFTDEQLAMLCAQYDRRINSLDAENKQLRELVDYMTPIAWYGASERERDRMRELGVEV